jgi:tetratricopeptide (TPR) repeat protein
MADFPRIEELKRRVQQDPASIAFAALADEYRRAGRFTDAVETCRAGLLRHPAYLSARVTLGRALLELGEFDEAEAELQQVLRAAPENLAAIRALADIHHRRGDAPDRVPDVPVAEPAPSERSEPKGPALSERSEPKGPALSERSEPKGEPEPTKTEPLIKTEPLKETAPADISTTAVSTVVPFAAPPPIPVSPVSDPALAKLERLLAAIQRARRELDAEMHTGR